MRCNGSTPARQPVRNAKCSLNCTPKNQRIVRGRVGSVHQFKIRERYLYQGRPSRRPFLWEIPQQFQWLREWPRPEPSPREVGTPAGFGPNMPKTLSLYLWPRTDANPTSSPILADLAIINQALTRHVQNGPFRPPFAPCGGRVYPSANCRPRNL